MLKRSEIKSLSKEQLEELVWNIREDVRRIDDAGSSLDPIPIGMLSWACRRYL